MKNKLVPTAVFNSDMSSKTKNEEKLEITNGKNKLIFMTPEYFVKSENFIKEIEDELDGIKEIKEDEDQGLDLTYLLEE